MFTSFRTHVRNLSFVFLFPTLQNLRIENRVFKRENLSAVHLKDFRLNTRFLANYVQSFRKTHYVCDFCFFSSRKRRNNICLCLFFIFPIRGWPVPDSIRELAPTGDLEWSIAKAKKAPSPEQEEEALNSSVILSSTQDLIIFLKFTFYTTCAFLLRIAKNIPTIANPAAAAIIPHSERVGIADGRTLTKSHSMLISEVCALQFNITPFSMNVVEMPGTS